MAGKSTQSGFTLLETLTAMTILAMALAALMGTFSSGIAGARITDQRSHAVILAQTLFSAETARLPTGNRARSGKSGSLQWRVTVAPVSAPVIEGRNDKRWRLYRIVVDVMMQGKRRYSVETLKLGAA